MRVVTVLLFGVSFLILTSHAEDRNFWNQQAKAILRESLNLKPIHKRAKNVIFFLGDGMGISTVTAARFLKTEHDVKNQPNIPPLSFETWPHVGLSMTYTTSHQVSDSAGTATAFLTGVKTQNGVIGVDSSIINKNCSSYDTSKDVQSFLQMATDQNKAVGLITTTRITHATPAASYAHTPSRSWESDKERDKDVPASLRSRCPDIATQMLTNAMDFRVILGGGLRNFRLQSQNGSRNDSDLITKWKSEQKKKGRRHRFIQTGEDLRSLNPKENDYLLGLFAKSHMDYEFDRRKNGRIQPSLSEMTDKAIQILRRDPKGFILFIESGRIDHGHHRNTANLALFDTLAMNEAVESAIALVDKDETLMLVTSDHSHVFTFGGYPTRMNPILSVTDYDIGLGKGKAKDGKLFTTLLYANGPSAPLNTNRPDVNQHDALAPTYKQQSAVPLKSETHAGEDVGIYARGPMAYLFHGVHEQHYVAHVIMYSQCYGPYSQETHCPLSNSIRIMPSLSFISVISFVINIRWFF